VEDFGASGTASIGVAAGAFVVRIDSRRNCCAFNEPEFGLKVSRATLFPIAREI
jgi:hypothetical protein